MPLHKKKARGENGELATLRQKSQQRKQAATWQSSFANRVASSTL
jgi:hypothetical protein